MFFLIIVALIILSTTVSLHYFQHFETCWKRKSKPFEIPSHSPRAALTLSKTQRNPLKHTSCNCNCALTPRDGEKFDFFPASFFYYLLFKIMLCVLIIIFYQNTPNQSVSELLFTSSAETHEQHSIFEYHSIHLMHGESALLIFLNYILIYSVMLVSVWESLFSFYKYYTTQFIVSQCELVPAKQVITKFMMYAILFCIVFNLQIHFYYYLFPVVLMLHFLFNTYCTLKFSSVLIAKYQFFLEIEQTFPNKENENILNSVYLMRRTSMICCILQTLYLALFTISYTVNMICYLPILWSISGCIYTFNFIRNRRFILFKIFEYKQHYKSTATNVLRLARTFSTADQCDTNDAKSTCTSSGLPLNAKPRDSMTEIQIKTGSGCNTVSNSVSMGEHALHIENDAYDNYPTSAPQIRSFDCYTSSLNMTKRESAEITKKTSKGCKALEILGISAKKPRNVTFPPPVMMVHSHSDMIFAHCPSMSQPKAPVFSQSDITTTNKIMVNRNVQVLVSAKVKGQNKSVSAEEESMTYFPQLPLRRVSSPKIVIDRNDINININDYDATIEINLDEIDYIDDGADEEEEDECVYIHYKGENMNVGGDNKLFDINEDGEDLEEIDIDLDMDLNGEDILEKKLEVPAKERKGSQLKLKHQVSTSAPDVSQIADLVDVMGSLELFAKYGFCSRNSVNSLYQLTRYQYGIKKV